jgi:hypothetical protein
MDLQLFLHSRKKYFYRSEYFREEIAGNTNSLC